MIWNWQQPDWPNFTWNPRRLAQAESLFLEGAGIIVGASQHFGPEDQNEIKVQIISREAVDTSEIEGEHLNRGSVQSSVRRQFGLATDQRKATPAEAGIAEMMIHLYQNFSTPLTEKTLFLWHHMMMNSRRDLTDLGRYRTHSEPMQIVSGPSYAPKVHYEAPPSYRIPHEMNDFMGWFTQTAPDGDRPLPSVTRAGLAHLWFETIHPFEDGNGRIGRAIAEKALAQGVSMPILTSLAPILLKRRKEYYHALEMASQSLEVTGWLLWFATAVIEAQRYTQAHIGFLIHKTKLLDKVRGQINARQEKALLRMFAEGLDGFKGGLSAQNYMTITAAPSATTTRDLSDLVEKGALYRTGEHKSSRYHLAIPIQSIASVSIADIA